MNWFFAPAIRLFSGTKISANLYWIGVLAFIPLLILIGTSASGREWLADA